MQNTLLPEIKKVWFPPRVEREKPLSAASVAQELKKHFKTIGRVLNIDMPKNSSFHFLEEFVEEWLSTLLKNNVMIPVSAKEICGLADMLDWIDEIRHKRSDSEADNALKNSLKFLIGELGKEGEVSQNLVDFKTNPDIPYIKSYAFMEINGEINCVKMLDPDFFSNPVNDEIYYMRSLLSNGTPMSYGSLILINMNQYGEFDNRLEILEMGKRAVTLAMNSELNNGNEFEKAVSGFMARKMKAADRRLCLDNALEITDAMKERMRQIHAVSSSMGM